MVTMHQKLPLFFSIILLAFVSASAQGRDTLPIYINTSEVIPTKTKTPLILYSDFIGTQVIRNTGNSIQFDDTISTSIYITGGLVGDSIYKLCNKYLLINQNPHGRSGVVVNGVVFPIIGMNVFCKLKYGSYENAIKYPYGTVTLMQPVTVGVRPNIAFEPFKRILLSGEIKQVNTTSITLAINTFSWYDSIFKSFAYMAYKGSYVDPDGKKVAISRALVTQPPYNYMSYKQFAAFENVFGNNGHPIQTILPISSRKNIIIRGSRQILPILNPFGFIGFPLQLIYSVFYRISAATRVIKQAFIGKN